MRRLYILGDLAGRLLKLDAEAQATASGNIGKHAWRPDRVREAEGRALDGAQTDPTGVAAFRHEPVEIRAPRTGHEPADLWKGRRHVIVHL